MKTVEELNAVIRNHRANNKLNKTELAVLDVLARHSCKEVGRSWLSKSTIAELVGKSRRTIVRVCNRLEELGIISQHARKRQTGDRRQTSNLIVIMAVKVPDVVYFEPVTPECHTEEAPQETINNNTSKETDASALRRSIPQPIYEALKPYFDADGLFKTYGILLRAKASIDRNITVEEYAAEFIDAFKAVVYKYKRGQVRNLLRYLFVTWRQVATEIKRRITIADSDVFYDWTM